MRLSAQDAEPAHVDHVQRLPSHASKAGILDDRRMPVHVGGEFAGMTWDERSAIGKDRP
jgi:hypothetical protein